LQVDAKTLYEGKYISYRLKRLQGQHPRASAILTMLLFEHGKFERS